MNIRNPWEKAYQENKFKITTLSPSIIVNRHKNLLNKGDFVLDIGCGNGRNSAFLASWGCIVDSFDVADLGWVNKLSEKLKKNITFIKSDILSFNFKPDFYKAFIVTRIIQYIDRKELVYLFDKIHTSLKPDGFVLLNYNTEGGIFNRKEINVPKYLHSVKEVEKILKTKFNKIVISLGSAKSQSVNYSDDIKAYDLFITGKK